MVTEVTEAPEVDQAPVQTETETPVEAVEAPAEGAAPEEPEAAAQIEVTEPTKPDYITREEWEKERREVAERAAAEALEADRRRRQTENARKAQQEKRDAELKAETADVVRATLSARLGVDPSLITDEAIDTAIVRVARRQAEHITADSLELVDRAFDYLTAPAYGKEADWDDALAPAAGKLQPKLQHLINTVRPAIEAAAREGYIHKDELPKHVEAEIARRNAKAREGQEDLKRTGPAPATGTTFDELEHLFAVGEASPQQEAEYKRMRAERGL